MANTIKHKRGSGSNPSASDLVAGEIAIRTDTGVLFTKKDDNSVVSISGGSTNLGVSTTSSAVTVTSSTGNNATISEATGSAAGVMSTAHHDKLDGIEANATADQSASEILTAIKTVDGTGSGLDADTLDGVQGSSFLRSDAADTKSSGDLSFSDNVKAVFGGGSDLQIYHDGNNSFIKDAGTGRLSIVTSQLQVTNAADSEVMIKATQDGAAELYHNGAKKLETSSSGISVTGNVVVSGTVDGRDVASDGSKLDGIAAGAQVNVGTNLSRTTTASANTIVSSTGNNVTLTEATNSAAGLMTTAHHSKLDGIESGATADQSASEILTLIKTVDGSGSGLDADTVDGISSASFLRSDTADTASGDITFSGGAAAVNIAANSDIRLASGNWTGNAYGKIQHHNNTLYILGGTNGITFREDGTDRCLVDGSGHFRPASDNTYDLGTSSNQWRHGYFNGTVNADVLDVDGPTDILGNLTLHANLDLQDNDYILLGTGDDLQIHHNASDSYITNATGELVVINYANDQDIILATDNGSGGIIDYVRCDGGVGEVKLYYYGSQKFNTKSDGVNVVGECECDSLDVDGNADIAGNITLSASNPTLTFSGGCNINSPSANNLDFLTGGTDRMRITSAGDVRIRNFSPRIGASISSVSSNFSAYFAAQGTGGGNLPMIVERYNDNGVAIEFKRNTSVVGNINVTPTTTNYVTSSDYRLKENVVDLDDAITRVKQLAPKRFNFTVEPDITVDGFLAHEAQTVVPEAVTGTQDEVQVWDENDQTNGDLPDGVSVGDNKLDEDGNTIPVYQGIDQAKLVPLLTAALQEAITKIETLEAKVAALESA